MTSLAYNQAPHKPPAAHTAALAGDSSIFPDQPVGADFAPSGGFSEAAASTLGIHADFVSPCNYDLRRTNAVNRRFTLQSNARILLPDFKIAHCLRAPLTSLVEVHHHAEFKSASYGGLQTCGSSHVCSVCGAKIGERRALEISTGAAAQLDKGGDVLMATFTLQHNETDTLANLLGILNEGYRRLRQGKAWQGFEKQHGITGSITSREYTFGSSGWHPHLHALFFVRGGMKQRELIQLQNWLKQRWSSVLEKLGGYASWGHGVRVQITNDGGLADYVSKAGRSWTVGDELAKANSKNGRRGGQTVPQLLWASGFGDERAGKLFQEYAQVTYNTSAVRWSPGLRKYLGLDEKEKSDEDVAAETVAGGRLLVVFDRGQWHVILRNDARAEVLLSAAGGDSTAVATFVRGLGIELEPWQLDCSYTPE